MTEPRIYVPRGRFQTEAELFMLDRGRAQMNLDPGIGKTVVTANVINTNYLCGESHPTLVIAPLRVAKSVWSHECAKWQHLRHLEVSPILGTEKKRLKALQKDVPIYTINYENVKWLVKHLGGKWPFRTVVCDESTKLKSNRSYISQSKLGNRFLVREGGMAAKLLAGVMKHTHRWYNLTGSFGANGLEEVWPQIFYIDGGKRLGTSFSSFTDRWFKTGWNGYGLVPHDHAEAEIRELISDICFTLAAEDYFDLPDEIVNTVWVDLPTEQMLQYKAMEREMFIEIEAGEVEVFTAASKMNKCHQIANGAVYYDDEGRWEFLHDAKIEAMQDLVEGIGASPTIVVYKFKSDLIRLRKAFPQGMDLNDKGDPEGLFKAGKLPLLFLHPKSAAHGIDGFQNVSHNMIFFSLDWDNELREQVVARIGKVRQMQAGFNRPVFIHQLAASNTVDEDIMGRIEGKLSVEESLKRGLARRFH